MNDPAIVAPVRQLICPHCRRRTSRKWSMDRAPHGYGWCRHCVPAVPVVTYDPPQRVRARARAKAQIFP